MTLLASDLKVYGCLNLPADMTSTVGGGIDTSNEITGEINYEIFLRGINPPEGESNTIDYSKLFIKNTNGSDDLNDGVIFLVNHLNKPATDAKIYLYAENDTGGTIDDTYSVIFTFENATGDFIQETVELNSVNLVNTLESIGTGKHIDAELVTSSGSSPVSIGFNIVISCGTVLGKIPAGLKSASSRISFGMEASLDDTATATNRATAPSGITFYQCNSYSAGMSVPNSGVLTAGSAVGIWLKRENLAGYRSISTMQIVPTLWGTD